MTFLPSELIQQALNAIDDTARDLEKLRNIFRQRHGGECPEVRTIQGCMEGVQRRYAKLQIDYDNFRDMLFNHPDQYYEQLGVEGKPKVGPCGDPDCSVCESFKDKLERDTDGS